MDHRIEQVTGVGFSLRRVGAMVLRYAYLLRGSWPRILELAYWPTVQMILWGFITVFLQSHSSWLVQGFGVLISGVLLWDVLYRGELGVGISFLEEMWSRNLGHIFVSPLRPYEFIVALVTMSLIRTLVGILPAAALAILFYDYSIFGMGLPLVAFFVNLIVFGWSLGLLVCAVLLRWGLGAESFAWLAVFALAPVSAIYYPVSVLPDWLQVIALAMPPAHVFEGMRSVIFDRTFPMGHFFSAVGLNFLYLGLMAWIFLQAFRSARRRGLILQIGE